MMKATRLKRRPFLGWLVGSGVSACSSFSLIATASVYERDNSLQLFDYSAETDQLGYYYLSEFPEDAQACRRLLTMISSRSEEYKDRDSRLRRTIHKKICDDFRQDNTVKLYGWILSRTELRLATLNILHT